MIFGLFKKTDPICGMKEEKGRGMYAHGMWFCNQSCQKEFEKKEGKPSEKKGGCCGH